MPLSKPQREYRGRGRSTLKSLLHHAKIALAEDARWAARGTSFPYFDDTTTEIALQQLVVSLPLLLSKKVVKGLVRQV